MSKFIQPAINDLLNHGMLLMPLADIETMLNQHGYKLNRDNDCHGTSKILTGELTGTEYSACTMYIERNDGVSWANANIERDVNWFAVKHIRDTVFTVNGGVVYSL